MINGACIRFLDEFLRTTEEVSLFDGVVGYNRKRRMMMDD